MMHALSTPNSETGDHGHDVYPLYIPYVRAESDESGTYEQHRPTVKRVKEREGSRRQNGPF